MSNGKNLIVAFDSVTMRSYISNLLRNFGYTVFEAADGVETFNLIFTNEIDCVLCAIDLRKINGYSLSRIIKNTKGLNHLAVILIALEDGSVHRFWSSNSKSDAFYVARPNNGDYLKSLVESSIQKMNTFARHELKETEKQDLFNIITKAYDNEMFNLFITQKAYNSLPFVSDLTSLLNRMAETLSGVCEYDAAGFLINEEPIIERYYKKGPISQEGFDDFIQICQNDFKSRVNRKEFNFEMSDSGRDEVELFDEEIDTIKSYEIFPLDKEKRYPVTFHIASCNENTFNTRTRERLDFFTSVYSLLIETSVSYCRSKRSEERMRHSFSRFLPPKIIHDIVEEKTFSLQHSVGEERKIAVLIADIRDFTTISELNSPETVVRFLNYFFSVMGTIIRKHGGTIDKFMGDAIMALFGAPDSYIDNGNRAANAALEMCTAKIDTSMLKMPENYNFDYGVGVHFGDMIVGTIGSHEKKDYTAIGDNVNIASRVEGLTKIFGSSIIVTEAVKKDMDKYKDLQNQDNTDSNNIPHSTRTLGVVKVKGKTKPITIYEISPEMNKYSSSFTENYSKGLDRYIDGDLQGALTYFSNAQTERPDDRASKYCIEQCNKFIANGKDENWDGSFKFLVK